MNTLIERISEASLKAQGINGKLPTELFLGKKEIVELSELFKSMLHGGKRKVAIFDGMAVHETQDETIIATGWKI